MSAYMITYFLSDTCGCGHDHEHNHEHNHEHIESSEDNIIAKIKSVGAWAHFMPEAYLVKSTLSAQKILEELKEVANTGDILFVTKTDAESCACQNQAVIDWLAK
ncbi:hypothetical protein [Clostridium cellulovorans]|uniref:Uncharacterized protein n=1 Tax=Clostridium cellulovorans (strain ATCC 35296 / DSM 3052 / OCM 3 / 743B) TaxID=573061 RepID=D9SV99_CLOC7|nr:hypothetical protein [Clostridium cellulovorans]ADL53073.1 hypothetical protein Clocel_3394 [Clostridium cellulovorans 743B]